MNECRQSRSTLFRAAWLHQLCDGVYIYQKQGALARKRDKRMQGRQPIAGTYIPPYTCPCSLHRHPWANLRRLSHVTLARSFCPALSSRPGSSHLPRSLSLLPHCHTHLHPLLLFSGDRHPEPLGVARKGNTEGAPRQRTSRLWAGPRQSRHTTIKTCVRGTTSRCFKECFQGRRASMVQHVNRRTCRGLRPWQLLAPP